MKKMINKKLLLALGMSGLILGATVTFSKESIVSASGDQQKIAQSEKHFKSGQLSKDSEERHTSEMSDAQAREFASHFSKD
jgi:hypothetical protein